MNPRYLHLFFSTDDTAGSADDKGEKKTEKKAEQKSEPTQSDREKELLREVAKLRKERDAFEADAKRYKTQAHGAARSKIAADLVDERYAKFLPDVDFDDDGKPTEASQKILDEFRAEFPDFFKAADAGEKKADKKPVLPAGAGGKTRAYWDDLKKTQPAKWREPATQREYSEWLNKQP